MALASRLSLATSKLRVPALFSTLTRPFRLWVNTPNGPLTVIACAEMATSAPAGTAIGILATRDMSNSLSDVANNFAADTGGACFAVRHDALRSRHDRHTQAIHHSRDLVFTLVDAQTRTGHALQALNDGTANIILQTDFQFRFATSFGNSEIFNVTLVLQDVGNRNFDFRRWHGHGRFLHALGVTNAGQHIGDRIAHTHCIFSYYQLALVIPGISPRMANSRSLLRPRPNWRNVPRGRPVMAQRLRWRVGLALRGSFCRPRRAAARSSSLRFASLEIAFSSACFFAYLATSLSRLSSRSIKAILATG